MGDRAQEFLRAAAARPELTGLFTAFDPTVPQVALSVDREKARTLGVPLPDVFSTLQASLGGAYVNDFNRFGRLYRVFVQADADFRQKPEDIGQFYVRSHTTGAMIPLSALVTIDSDAGAESTLRYNLLRSVEISGQAAAGYSSGQAMQALEEVADKLRRRGVRVVMCEANDLVRSKLERAGIPAMLGEGSYADDLTSALRQCAPAVVPNSV